MKFIPSRELRLRPGQVWKTLRKERELVVTSHGQPVALMVPVTADDLPDAMRSIRDFRRARAKQALRTLQAEAARKGLDKMTMDEIDEIIRTARREQRT